MTDKLKQSAQAIASGDHNQAYGLLNDIRSCSSPTGNASERLGYCFANGLEARLSGNYDLIYQRSYKREIKEDDVLKAYEVYYKACPVQKASHFLSNQTIIDLVKEKESVHIIDFGIGMGLQWPRLMELLSKMVGGPPKLRITGVDMPLPGLYHTNHAKVLLEYFAKKFNVPFEYKSIESKWEDVSIESLNVNRDEVLIVNCLSHSGYISEDILSMHGPSNPVLDIIRELNPAAFIHGRADVSSNAPSFVPCFNEALLHYSALFEMVDKNLQNDEKKCLLLDIFGREISNIMAFPEIWETRCEMKGFVQCHVNPHILKDAQDKVESAYMKDFFIREENKNVILGWKGRMLFTLSVWRPSQRFEAQREPCQSIELLHDFVYEAPVF